MGKSLPIRYAVQLYPADRDRIMTSSEWRARARYGMRGHGAPTVENLRRYVEAYNASTAIGGCNSHLGLSARASGGHIFDQRDRRMVCMIEKGRIK